MENLLKNSYAEEPVYTLRVTGVGKKLVVLLLLGYKSAISPLLLPACRYVPTCSEYAMEAVDRYGVLCGTAKAFWRLLRCHPFAKGGLDPVVTIRSRNISKADACNH